MSPDRSQNRLDEINERECRELLAGHDSGRLGVVVAGTPDIFPVNYALDAAGDVIISDATNDAIRFVPASSGTYFGQSMIAGDVYTVAGNGTAGYSGDGSSATSAELNSPTGIAIDASGGIVIADIGNTVIRYLAATTGTHYGQSMTAGDIYTIAGDATAGYSSDGSAATSAELNYPQSVSLDSHGNLVIADTSNGAVRYVPVTSGTYFGQSMTADDIYTIAGDGSTGYSGDGGAATSAELTGDTADATVDAAGDLYIAEGSADTVRFVPATSGTYFGQSMTGGDIYTVAGQTYVQGDYGDGGPATDAATWYVESVAPDSSGGFYLSDSGTNNVRYVTGSTSSSSPPAETTYAYDTDSELTSTVSPDGNVSGANAGNYTTVTTYNDDGEPTAVSVGDGTGHTVTPRTTDYAYDADGNKTSMTDPRGKVTTYAYNADDEQTLVTNPDGAATLTCYDGDGNVTETVPPVGVAANSLTPSSCPTAYPTGYGDRLASDATTTVYNALGEKTTVTTPAPAGQSGYETTTSAYDPAGLLTSVTAPPTSTSGGAADDVTAYTYDAAGELLTTTTGSGTDTAATTSYCYDPDGDQTAEVAPDGNTSSVAACGTSSPYDTSSSYQTTYRYDSLGEVVTTTAPDTAVDTSGMTTTTTYDPAGNVLTSEDANGVTTTSTYTPLNQVATVSYSDGTHEVTSTYDADGNETQMSDGTGTTTSTYDPFGELTSLDNGAGKTVSYTYDADGNTTGITYPLGSGATWATSDTVTYGYDDASQLTSVTDFGGTSSSITNSADGLPSAIDLGSSGDSIDTSYDPTDSPSSITLTDGSTLQEFAYSDEPSGAVASETDTPSSAIEPADYTYDAESRVTQMTPGSDSSLNYTEDASSNLTTLPTGASGIYDDASELTSSVLSGTTTDYTYNADGERTGESVGGTGAMSATYNGADTLSTYDNATADMTAATYDGNGLRASATSTPSGGSSSTQDFVWDETGSVPRLLMDSTYAYIYGPGSTPIAEVNLSTGTVRYLVADALGSVRGIVSSSGSLTASTSYDAWGNPETTGGLLSYTPFGFTGGYTDPTGLIYLIDRYYDPQTGQFVSVDPLVDETGQAYAYTGDNPVNEADPNGLATVGICADAGGQVDSINGIASDCLTRTIDASGEDDIGLVSTVGLGTGLGAGGYVGVSYAVSNVTDLQELGGIFNYETVDLGLGYGGTATVFWGTSTNAAGQSVSIYGVIVGISVGADITGAVGVSETAVDQFNNVLEANIARGVWDAANPDLAINQLLNDAKSIINSIKSCLSSGTTLE